MAKARKSFNRSSSAHSIPREEGMQFLKDAKEGDLQGAMDFVQKYGETGIDLRDRDWSPRGEPLWKTQQQTALFIASWEKHKNIVEYLLKHGADVDAQDKYGYTPLMASHEPGMSALLLDAGAKIELKDKEGGTALMWPTTAEMIKFLLSRGANVEARDNEGKTALMRVAEGHYARGHATVEGNIEALLDGCADINARDDKGQTPLMKAALNAVYSSENVKARVMLLLERGADPGLRDNDGNTAAMLARIERPELDGNIVQQAAIGELLEKEVDAREEHVRKLFTEGPAQGVGVMKPLQLKR